MMQLIENAREAFEAESKFIPTQCKIQYLNQLTQAGYFAIDLGKYEEQSDSQFNDIEEVISSINKKRTQIIILADTAERYFKAQENPKIDFIEIPFLLLEKLKEKIIAEKTVVSITINFQNNIPEDKISSAINYCKSLKITKIKLYGRITKQNENEYESILYNIKNTFPDIDFILHFYFTEENYKSIFTKVLLSGYSFIETSIKGWGRSRAGRTIPTEKVLTYLAETKEKTKIDVLVVETAYNTAKKIFSES